MKRNRVFILGASGFLGGRLFQSLHKNYECLSVGRTDAQIYYDLMSSTPEVLSGLVNEGDFWIFLAAISSPEQCENKSEYARHINVINTKKLISFLILKGVNVIFCSSDSVYGGGKDLRLETDATDPIGNYAEHKSEVEAAFVDSDFVKIIRLSYIFGGGDKFSKDLIRAVDEAGSFQVFDGFMRRVVLLEDVIAGVSLLIERWGIVPYSIINFCGPELVGRYEMVQALKRYIETDFTISVVSAPDDFWAGRAKEINADCARFTELLGRRPGRVSEVSI